MAETSTATFYDTLEPIPSPERVFDMKYYVRVPDEWFLAVSDIQGSTAAVAAGRHSDVNFAAAAMIASLNNLCGRIPYQFGGDGAVVLIPPAFADIARRSLAQTRRFALQEFGLDLRIGLVQMAEITKRRAEVLVGRFEPAPASAYAVFLGDGIDLMESSIKGRRDDTLAQASLIDFTEDDGEPPDLTGLSCRWTPLHAARGKMVSLVIRGADHGALHMELTRIAGVPALNAGSLQNMQTKWPPRGIVREAKARRKGAPLWLMMLRVGIETLIAYFFIRYELKIPTFDGAKYRRDVLKGAVDFARSGENLALVFDCPEATIEAIRAYLEDRCNKGELKYGMHVSDHAVMTCLVTSIDDRHVHFIDGGDGGYTRAATSMEARVAADTKS